MRQLENLTLIEFRIVAYLADFSFMNSVLILLFTAFYKKVQIICGNHLKLMGQFVKGPPARLMFLSLVDTCNAIDNKP
jgi:hypothetical protein